MSEQTSCDQYAVLDDDEGVDLVQLLAVIGHYKLFICGTALLGALIAAVISLLLPVQFSSSTKILPPQQAQNSGVAAVLGQLGGLAGTAGGLAGIKNPNDTYVGVLESRTVADNLVKRFKLQEHYDEPTPGKAREVLETKRDIEIGKKDGMLVITTIDRDPRFAAELANGYAEELAKMTQSMALTEASQRRLFFEKQLAEVKNQLADAEVALRSTQEKTGMIQPAEQVRAIITTVAQLKGTIAAKEVELNALRTYAAAQNPELIRTQEQLRSLRAQLAKMEQSQQGAGSDFMVPTGQIPAVGVEYVRGARNVKYYETMFELLARQYELARIDEAKDAGLIQVLDRAIPAEQRTKPKRAQITLMGLGAGLVLGILFAYAASAYRRARSDPGSSSQWEQLASAWRLRRRG